MKRKREHTFFPLALDPELNNNSHSCSKNKLGGERASSGRTSTESVLSPQTSSEILKERGRLCKSFSPIHHGSIPLHLPNTREETDSDENNESDEEASLVNFACFADDRSSDYGYFTNPHAETHTDKQLTLSGTPINSMPEVVPCLPSNQTIVMPKPTRATTVFDFSQLLETLPEEKKPADKKRIT